MLQGVDWQSRMVLILSDCRCRLPTLPTQSAGS